MLKYKYRLITINRTINLLNIISNYFQKELNCRES